MKQVKLSDILESVAAKYESGEYCEYTCIRVRGTLFKAADTLWEYRDLNSTFEQGILNMGLDSDSTDAFIDVDDKQQARMIWLTWCAMMAREQGL